MPATDRSRLTIVTAFLLAVPQACIVSGHQLAPSMDPPAFSDDLGFQELDTALERQLASFRKRPRQQHVSFQGETYSHQDIVASAQAFAALVRETLQCRKGLPANDRHACDARFDSRLKEQFRIYRAVEANGSPGALLTGYYTPVIDVADKPGPEYRFPIYRKPDTEYQRSYSRRDIDYEGKLAGKGYELYYARDRFGLYVLHVEGGGKIRIHHENGRISTAYLLYDGDNGQEFSLIRDHMLARHMLDPRRSSRYDQRRYLQRNPEQAEQIFSSCRGYVFFIKSDSPPIGSSGVELTPSRSIATDPAYYPFKGMITYIVSPLPLPPPPSYPPDSNLAPLRYTRMHRFFLDQDIGHNVEGPARADIYFGESPYAEYLANNFLTRGTIYVLLLKKRATDG